MRYSAEVKTEVLKRILPPNNESVRSVSKSVGITELTLRRWRNQALAESNRPGVPGSNPEKWSSSDKFQVVLETAGMNEVERAAYCREKGLYVEQVELWREVCQQANSFNTRETKELSSELKSQQKRIKELEKELVRKEKALAETAAILVLRKKAEAIWGDQEVE